MVIRVVEHWFNYPTIRRIETYFGWELIVLLINRIHSEYSLSIEKKAYESSCQIEWKADVTVLINVLFFLSAQIYKDGRLLTDVSSKLTMLNSEVQIILDVDIHFHADIVS